MVYQILKESNKMKKTVLTSNIDDEVIVVGFDRAVINPIATYEKVINELKQTEEHENYVSRTMVIAQKTKEHILLLGKRTKTDEAKAEKEIALEALSNEISSLQEMLKEDFITLNEKSKELHENHLVYFEPKIGEEIIEDETLIDTFESLQDDEALKIDGTIIPNHKGKIYFEKENGAWFERKVKKIGETIPSNAKLPESMTDADYEELKADNEKRRIKQLSIADKKKEKEDRLQSLLVEAANKKIQLEILGDDDPLGNSQAWYNEKKAEIEEKYA